MTDLPAVDVLVVTYNTADLTAAALRRLLDVDQGAALTVLVHDNASADGTAAVLAQRVPEARVEVGTDNLGFADGVNRLFARSTAPWLLVLNSDAWPDPGTVGRLVEVARKHPEAGIVAPRLESPDGVLEQSTHPTPSVLSAWSAALSADSWAPRWAAPWFPAATWGHDEPRDVDWAVGAAWLVRRAALEQTGPLDTTLFMYGEDVEWCLRMRDHGWTVRFDPSVLVRHVGDASGEQAYAGNARAQAWVRNDLLLYRRRSKATSVYALGRAVGARRAARAAARRGNSEGAAHWRAVAAAYLTRSSTRR